MNILPFNLLGIVAILGAMAYAIGDVLLLASKISGAGFNIAYMAFFTCTTITLWK